MIKCVRNTKLAALALPTTVALIIYALSSFMESGAKDRSINARAQVLDLRNACGRVCLVVVSHLFDSPISLAASERYVAVNNLNQTSIAELACGIRAAGYATLCVRLRRADLNTLKMPAVLFVNNNHFVVSVLKEHVGLCIIDPPLPPLAVGIDALPYDWNGIAILVHRNPAELVAATEHLNLHDTNGVQK